MSGKPAARQGDMTQYGGSIVQGSAGVRIGAPTGVTDCGWRHLLRELNTLSDVLGGVEVAWESVFALPGPLPFILSGS
ncbi:hypothetical protein, partial [Escherichia coli]|uniref:hypothetical protein n=1 Tax=Escherichia coli TaxID=562 RepID=UPI001D0A9C7B